MKKQTETLSPAGTGILRNSADRGDNTGPETQRVFASPAGTSSSASLTGALSLTAHSFVSIARPGDVFSFEGKRHVVESVGLFPVVIRTTDKVTLRPDADALVSWERVAP